MAFHLQFIYGTEQDRVNCPFYFKIGACTYGERCSRLHNKPTESQTVLIMNMYHTPYTQYGPNSEPLFDLHAAQEHLDDFYEDIFLEMAQWGEIEEIYCCRNLGGHLNGNCYIKFYEEESAAQALEACRGRYYSGRPIVAELSPVTDFREARCRQFDVGECNRGGFCNFMHLAEPSRPLRSKLYDWQRKVQRRKRKKEMRERRKASHEKHDDKDREEGKWHGHTERHRDEKTPAGEAGRTEREGSSGHKRSRDQDGTEDGGDRTRERERDRPRDGGDRDHRERERDRDRTRTRTRNRDRDRNGDGDSDRLRNSVDDNTEGELKAGHNDGLDLNSNVDFSIDLDINTGLENLGRDGIQNDISRNSDDNSLLPLHERDDKDDDIDEGLMKEGERHTKRRRTNRERSCDRESTEKSMEPDLIPPSGLEPEISHPEGADQGVFNLPDQEMNLDLEAGVPS